ncbi:sensor histidine kinase [Halovivax limisalsi]|uniref:sensor histidine kinase n=1 Tax=Halovivax limisalsi TaxID=1453760 RepID=UPI001FFD016D|nr:HAMP domain-containing sensor histidine kinase [Halovivax limisalsi]
MNLRSGYSSLSKTSGVLIIRALGLLFAFGLVAEFCLFYALGSSFIFTGSYIVGIVSMLPFLIGILYAPFWLRRSDLSSARYPRLIGWLFGGLVTFLAMNLAVLPTRPPESPEMLVSWLRWATVIGTAVGLMIGIIEARAIERATVAEREAVRTEQLEEQRNLLDYLNSILRHEILNSAAIIDGYACRLRDDADPLSDAGREWATVIHEEAGELEAVIDDVRFLLATAAGDHELEAVELTAVLQEEVTKLNRAHEDVSIETAMPSSVRVRGDELLGRVFGNILSNAVVHNDDPNPHVSIAVEERGETVRVEIEDDGPGIPAEKRETLFERDTNHASTHGLGLYLVDSLVSQYGGEVSLTETGPEGSQFTVELLRASTDAERAVPDEPEAPQRS